MDETPEEEDSRGITKPLELLEAPTMHHHCQSSPTATSPQTLQVQYQGIKPLTQCVQGHSQQQYMLLRQSQHQLGMYPECQQHTGQFGKQSQQDQQQQTQLGQQQSDSTVRQYQQTCT